MEKKVSAYILLLFCFAKFWAMVPAKPIGSQKQIKEFPFGTPEHEYLEFQQFHSVRNYNTNELKQMFPLLYQQIPNNSQSMITNYLDFAYRQNVESELDRIKQSGNTIKFKELQWKALALGNELMPEYKKNDYYFAFKVAPSKNSLLKGKSNEASFLEYSKQRHYIEQIYHKQADKQQMLKELQNTYAVHCNNAEFKFNQKCRDLESKIQTTEIELIGYQKEMVQLAPGLFDKASQLVKRYRIGLTPVGDLSPYIIRLIHGLKNDPELQKLILSFYVAIVPENTHDMSGHPRIVIIPSPGKENAQKALNKLYTLFKDAKGMGIPVKYHAKINDLIWISQGNPNYKNDPLHISVFQGPELIYYKANITGQVQDHYLQHPETKKIVIR